MKAAILAAVACTAVASGASAQTGAAAPEPLTAEHVYARAEQLRQSVAAMRADITRVSRDPSLPEEQRAAEVENLSAKVQRESDEVAALVDRYMAARKEEARRAAETAQSGSGARGG